MNTAEKVYELVKAMPEAQANEVLHFAEFLKQKAHADSGSIKQGPVQGTLTGLRGMAKRAGTPPTDEELRTEYTDYLIEKYQ